MSIYTKMESGQMSYFTMTMLSNFGIKHRIRLLIF